MAFNEFIGWFGPGPSYLMEFYFCYYLKSISLQIICWKVLSCTYGLPSKLGWFGGSFFIIIGLSKFVGWFIPGSFFSIFMFMLGGPGGLFCLQVKQKVRYVVVVVVIFSVKFRKLPAVKWFRLHQNCQSEWVVRHEKVDDAAPFDAVVGCDACKKEHSIRKKHQKRIAAATSQMKLTSSASVAQSQEIDLS